MPRRQLTRRQSTRRTSGRALLALAALSLSLCAAAHARPARQGSQRRPPRAAAATALPSPASALGFTPGDERTIADWRQITGYFARLDEASPRLLLRTLGRTTLGRPLVVAFLSAPENIRNLAKYQDIQRRLADPRLVATDAERDRLVAEGKAVVAVSCSIHSTEIVASQMSMQLAYELAAAEDEETREILQNTILLLIPSANPDGVDIVADWYRKTLGTPHEGTEPPELYHHYAGHDNNRDWFMLNLRETQQITRLFWKEWFPQLVYDVHQMGSGGARLFIPPFYDPPNPHIAPLLLREVGLVGHRVAADLQAAGFKGVITNAQYDTWWHGGFRTAPYYHNSVGILSEAASARLMTPVNVTPEQLARSSSRGMPSALQAATNFPDPWPGGKWGPRDIARMELIAARAILSTAAKHRARYLRNFHDLGRRALDAARERGALGYVIPPGQGRDEAVAKLVSALVDQGVEVHRLERELHGTTAEQRIVRVAGRARATTGRGGESRTQPAPSAPAEREDQAERPAAAAADQTALVLSEQAHAGVHEIPAGSYFVPLAQPYAANVLALFEPQVYPDRRAPDGTAERPYDVAGWTLPMQMGVETKLLLSVRESAAERRTTPIRDGDEVRRDLGLRVRPPADQAPTHAGRTPPAGRTSTPAGQASSPSGTTPPPAGHASPVENPVGRAVRLGLYRSWTNSMDEGWTRFVFDHFNLPYTTLRDRDVRAGDLRSRFDVIVLPSMRLREIVEGRSRETAPAEFAGGIGEPGVEALRRFVEDGGTLVCFDASAELAIKRFNLPLRNVLEGARSSEFYCPGSILRIELDTAHPLARGLAREADAYFINSSAFETAGGGRERVRVVARYAESEVLRSGWLLGEKFLAGKIALAEVAQGRGRVVLFGFRPQHRGQTWGTFPLIWNAIAGARP
jgi:Zinc carboxypeptidase